MIGGVAGIAGSGVGTVVSGGAAVGVAAGTATGSLALAGAGIATIGNAVGNIISNNKGKNSGGSKGEVETNYGDQLEVSDQKMYQQGQHYNKHGKDMDYGSKKDYEAGARNFIENNKSTADIFEGKWNSSRGGQSGETQIIIRADGKQAIINKETGQIIDFYEGTSLDGFINVRQV